MNALYKFAVVLMLVCTLTACSPDKNVEQTSSDSSQDDFVTYGGPYMTATPDGYYVMQNGFLYYITADFSDNTIVCDKLNCIHNDKSVVNLNEYFACDAYYGENSFLDYYDGSLYIVGYNPNAADGKALYQVAPDGTDRTLIYQCEGQYIEGYSIYNGTAYIGEMKYLAASGTHCVTAVPLDNPENAEVLYETEEYPSRTVNQMKCGHGYCYFYLFDPAESGQESVYIRINLKTGEAEQLYKPSYCRIEMGKDRYMVYEQKFVSYNPAEWTEDYYLMEPENGELSKLTENDFESIKNRDMLRNMDDDYVYFVSINFGADEVPQQEKQISIYEYDGSLAAKISAAEFGNMYYILPGTDDYMFIQVESTDISVPPRFYYVDKSEFDGGTVEAHLIRIGETG